MPGNEKKLHQYLHRVHLQYPQCIYGEIMRFETEIKQWGNSLALRIPSSMALEPQFVKGTKVVIDTSKGGMKVVRKEAPKRFSFPFSEAELLSGLNPKNAHVDELAPLLSAEYGA